MATLERIRNRAGVLVSIVIGLALFAFILGDFLSSGGAFFNRSQMEIAEIAGNSISYEDFQAKVNENEYLQKLFSNQTSLNEQQMLKIREQVWQDLLRANILNVEYNKLGLSIHPDELFDMVQGRNIHPFIRQQFGDPQTGEVNKAFITNFLKNMDRDPKAKTYWLFLEKEIQKDRLFSKYLTLIRKGLGVTSLQANKAFNERVTKINFDYLVQTYQSVPDSVVEVTESDIKDYYEAHTNDYKQTASRDIEYVVFPISPSDEDVKDAEEWMKKAYEEFSTTTDPKQYVTLNSDSKFDSKYYKKSELPENISEWAFSNTVGSVSEIYRDGDSFKVNRIIEFKMLPDSVKARHILISPKGQTPDAKSAAKAKADSILNVLKRGGSWSKLAAKYSDDPGSNDKGGDLGWFPSGMMVPEFDHAAFNGALGELQLVETQFGYHILQVTRRGKEFNKVQIATLERKIVPSSVTTSKVYNQAAAFAGNNRTYDKFVSAADESNYVRRVANNLLPNDRNIAGLDQPRELIRWAYRAEKGDVSDVMQIGDSYIVAALTEVREEGIAPLKQVLTDVRYRALREKKAEYLINKTKEAMSGKADINALAQELGLAVASAENVSLSSLTVPNAGIEPAVIGVASVSEEGQLTGPVKGNNGVFVFTLTSKVKEEGDATMEKTRIANMYQSRAYYEVFEALKKNADIIDKRYNFY
ncbi:MAG: peptidyl-prolyl cis-trans isomerase [Tenuifilum sp.]|jgi:peptidyl-prolyl cis-trans isomerase D|uniref:peptidylprolyl isomerase n=1 Tax=Tenuifilum sp. TaxID=2760880 RepID=UPI0024AAE2AC|nr:SurA N-terminal domain-containing protein [Tenuifilum sp.]MDI3526292.1 peptidyl-prolyl cis-trans isomerase [Tenuifilum sp.]